MSKIDRVQVGVGVIIINNGKILLAKRKGSHGAGMWGSAGGHVEFGERPSEAIKREAYEELGIKLDHVKFLCVTDAYMENKHYVDIGFTADIGSGEPKIQPDEADKIEVVQWFDLENLPKPLFPPIKTYLEAIKTGKIYFEFDR